MIKAVALVPSWSRRRLALGHGFMTSEIRFYRAGDPYGEFSNFASFPIEVDGVIWPTSEHYFQAQKFSDFAYREEICATISPMIAARLGRSRQHPIHPNWDAIKDDVMRRALEAKFSQHPALKALLLGTGEALLIEHTSNDHYWADGGDGTGLNKLGLLLMELRASIRTSLE